MELFCERLMGKKQDVVLEILWIIVSVYVCTSKHLTKVRSRKKLRVKKGCLIIGFLSYPI